jgi:hypothetical protein
MTDLRKLPHGNVVRQIPFAQQSMSMARSVPAGTKVTTDRGDSGTLAQAWDGTSSRVIINSDKRGRIEVHPSNVYVNGRSLRDMAGGESMQAVHFTAQAEASWKSWYDRRTANITVQEAQNFRDALLELADKTDNRALHDKAVADAQRMSTIRVDVGTNHAGMKPLWDIVQRWPGVNAPTLKKVLYQWQDIAAGKA